jgi:radical SAM enzyme (TIGR01210 family)
VTDPAAYPRASSDRDRWILARRGSRNRLDPARPYGELHELEPDESGLPVPVSTVFLTNRECPWRCLMCDLWRNTLTGPVAPGQIGSQIAGALARLPPARWIKLYNAGSFFDPHAIPPGDLPEIARLLAGFERVIVESHPALVGESSLAFRDDLAGSLEVALGLETAHPRILPLLNKRMTLDDFRRAVAKLSRGGIAARAFVLIGLPFAGRAESLEWACRSVEFALDCGCAVVSMIPTRAGNGALDDLARRGEFLAPDLRMLEEALAFGLGLGRGRIFADLWDLDRLSSCPECFEPRERRLRQMNLAQKRLEPVPCASCGGGG